MDELKRLSQAVLQGAGIETPRTSIPELAPFFRSSFQLPAVRQGGQAFGTVAGERAEQEREAAAASRKARVSQLQDMLDPSKYEVRRKEDGGFDFFDPTGKQIDINTYTKRTGARRVDILKDSENPIDLQYVHDYSNLQGIMGALYNNDKATLNEVKKRVGGNVTPEDLSKKLMFRYPHLYGLGSYGETQKYRNQPLFNFDLTNLYSTGGSSGGRGGWRPS